MTCSVISQIIYCTLYVEYIICGNIVHSFCLQPAIVRLTGLGKPVLHLYKTFVETREFNHISRTTETILLNCVKIQDYSVITKAIV